MLLIDYIRVKDVLRTLKKYNLIKEIRKETKTTLRVFLNDTHQLYTLGTGYETWAGNIKENKIIINNTFYSMDFSASSTSATLTKNQLPDILIGAFLAKPYFLYNKQPKAISHLLRLKVMVPTKEILLYIPPK